MSLSDGCGKLGLDVPVPASGQLPVSLMLVGKHFGELTIYKAAFEAAG